MSSEDVDKTSVVMDGEEVKMTISDGRTSDCESGEDFTDSILAKVFVSFAVH
jgi:hypothetical protein